MKVTELKHPVSRRLTQPPVRLCVSPVWRSPASFNEHHFCRAGVRHPLVQTPVLDILDKLVLRHIFSLDPLMSLPAWEIACKNEHKDVEGCSRREFSRSGGRQVHKGHPEARFLDGDMERISL